MDIFKRTTSSEDHLRRELKLSADRYQNIIPNLANVALILEKQLRTQLWFDEFHQKIFYADSDSSGEWIDELTREATIQLQKDFHLPRLNEDVARKALLRHAQKDIRNEPRAWMESLSWDGVQRIANFVSEYLNGEKNEYSGAVGTNLLLSIVARTFVPGCQVDSVVILEGPQGYRKTSALRVLGGNWYADTHDRISSKDFLIGIQGKLLIEIPELSSFSGSDILGIKKVITTTNDRFRPPYDRSAKDFPRRCVFVGTTNESLYLNDQTGNRRFLPVKVKRAIDTEKISRDREQLFAEAVHLYELGENWWEVPEELLAKEHKSRECEDAWEGPIETFIENKQCVTCSEILQCLGLPLKEQNKGHQLRVGKILRVLGWHRIQAGNKRQRSWVRSEK
jgi:predicted P-loop ATPase